MARIKLSPLLSEVSGSIGGATFQRSQGGASVRNKPLRKPKVSDLTNQVKLTVSQVIAAWQSLSDAQRIEWNQFASYIPTVMKLNSKRQLNGFNVFVKYNCIRLAAGLSVLSSVTFIDPDQLAIFPEIYTVNEGFFIGVGQGTNSIAWSSDGISWTGLGTAIFSTQGIGVCWNGSLFVAVGQGTNSIAYSSNGTAWTGIGTGIFSSYGSMVCWNGSIFVAVGAGGNTIAWSSDGVNWNGIGTAIFSTQGIGVCYDSNKFVAVGNGTNSIAYSANGVNWTGLGTSIFSTQGNGVCWNGRMFVAVGQGTNSIAYSYDGINWIGIGAGPFSTGGNRVCWNGRMFVAAGAGGNTLAYSKDGISWTGLGTSIFSTTGYGICWNGQLFVAAGAGGNTLAYSANGINWTGKGTSIFSTQGRGVASMSVPNLFPVILHQLIFDFNIDLDGNDQFALLKLSNSRRATEGFRSNTTRIIDLTLAAGATFNIEDQIYALFGTNPFSGDILNCEVTPFSQDTGKVFPIIKTRCEISAT